MGKYNPRIFSNNDRMKTALFLLQKDRNEDQKIIMEVTSDKEIIDLSLPIMESIFLLIINHRQKSNKKDLPIKAEDLFKHTIITEDPFLRNAILDKCIEKLRYVGYEVFETGPDKEFMIKIFN